MDDQNTPSEPVTDVPAPPPADSPELNPVPVEPDSGQITGSDPADMPPTAPESPIADSNVPVEDQNHGVNQPESNVEEPIKEPQTEAVSTSPVQTAPAPAPSIPVASQTQSLVQQDQVGFIHSLLIKAQAKIQFNKQKKLDNLMQFAQKKRIITNSDVQKLLRVSDRTATRYLVKLVTQGRLTRIGDPHDAKYQFVR
jgi:hypothetical protein